MSRDAAGQVSDIGSSGIEPSVLRTRVSHPGYTPRSQAPFRLPGGWRGTPFRLDLAIPTVEAAKNRMGPGRPGSRAGHSPARRPDPRAQSGFASPLHRRDPLDLLKEEMERLTGRWPRPSV